MVLVQTSSSWPSSRETLAVRDGKVRENDNYYQSTCTLMHVLLDSGELICSAVYEKHVTATFSRQADHEVLYRPSTRCVLAVQHKNRSIS